MSLNNWITWKLWCCSVRRSSCPKAVSSCGSIGNIGSRSTGNGDLVFAVMDLHEQHLKCILRRTSTRHAGNTQCFDCSLHHVQRIISPSPVVMPRMHSHILLVPHVKISSCRHSELCPSRHHPEATRLWEEHISAMLKEVGFRNTMHEKNVYAGHFCGDKALLARQVDDFALGRCQESTARTVHSDVEAKLALHNEVEAPFEHLGLVNPLDGCDVLQTRNHIKLSAESYIWRLLEACLGQSLSTRIVEQTKMSLVKVMLQIYSIWQQSQLRMLPGEHKALEVEHGFAYRSVLGEILFAHTLCHAARWQHWPSSLRDPMLVKQASDCLSALDTRLENCALSFGAFRFTSRGALCDPVKFDNSLSVILLHHRTFDIAHVDAAHANELCQRRSATGCRCCLAGVVVAHWSRGQSHLSVRRAPRKPNSSSWTLLRKSLNACVSWFMNWGPLRPSLLPSTKTTTQRSGSSTASAIVLPIVLVMSKSDVLQCSIDDSWKTSSWFTFLGSWIEQTCSPKPWVRFSTNGMHPAVSWVIVAILADNLSWLCFPPPSPLRQCI